MASTPRYKVFNPSGEYVASCRHLEDAAAIVALYGHGATIRLGHTALGILWAEGAEAEQAAESFDNVRMVAEDRERAHEYVALPMPKA